MRPTILELLYDRAQARLRHRTPSEAARWDAGTWGRGRWWLRPLRRGGRCAILVQVVIPFSVSIWRT
jgi:hypothetical protein